MFAALHACILTCKNPKSCMLLKNTTLFFVTFFSFRGESVFPNKEKRIFRGKNLFVEWNKIRIFSLFVWILLSDQKHHLFNEIYMWKLYAQTSLATTHAINVLAEGNCTCSILPQSCSDNDKLIHFSKALKSFNQTII